MTSMLGEELLNLLVENQDLLKIPDETLEAYIDFIEEAISLQEEYVDLSFMDEDCDFIDDSEIEEEPFLKRGQQWEDSQTEEE